MKRPLDTAPLQIKVMAIKLKVMAGLLERGKDWQSYNLMSGPDLVSYGLPLHSKDNSLNHIGAAKEGINRESIAAPRI